MTNLETIFREKPTFHRAETEISRAFREEESFLPKKSLERMNHSDLACYSIGTDVLTFISENVTDKSKTLETGAGSSTLVFALKGAKHIAVTPSASEISLIQQYAAQQDISMSNVEFIQKPSEECLPNLDAEELDMVLLDGKHAFPWPMVDWFYTADKLKQGGLMLIDDTEMKPVNILVDFMKSDPGWESVKHFSGKTAVFRKVRASIHDVAWHMQPYTMPGRFERIVNRLRQMVRGK